MARLGCELNVLREDRESWVWAGHRSTAAVVLQYAHYGISLAARGSRIPTEAVLTLLSGALQHRSSSQQQLMECMVQRSCNVLNT